MKKSLKKLTKTLKQQKQNYKLFLLKKWLKLLISDKKR